VPRRRAPRFHRHLTLLAPGGQTRGPTGQVLRGSDPEHAVRAERRDLTVAERFAAGISTADHVTRFLVRRGDLPQLPATTWKVRDDRATTYDVESVTVPDGWRDDDPRTVVTVLCTVTEGVA